MDNTNCTVPMVYNDTQWYIMTYNDMSRYVIDFDHDSNPTINGTINGNIIHCSINGTIDAATNGI